MPLYLVSVESSEPQTIENLDASLKANALKILPISKSQRLVQYGGGGAENLLKRIATMGGPVQGLSIFKIAPDYALPDSPAVVAWLNDAVNKAAF